ncbi:restriction endonuclease subunit S [Allochromatium humboldtianum]|uniref:Restriction endonuclease subunit S n=1 Tax=Allochromatium humboldtianum TaxID=504901 RepID=A0A850RPN1_9GAMM|nr:restriction endonuclease subunit S [Allochromatium humboldtianum]NVZ11441.1 restriction endonuclease subunit S [Allochromatium humboldtianum]
MSFPRYERYKDSGVEWLGEVPEHWEVRPLKYLVAFRSGGTPSKENMDYWNGEVPWASAKDIKAEILSDTIDHITEYAIQSGVAELIPTGSVLIVVRGMILARTFPVCFVEKPMAINQDLKALECREGLDARFLARLLQGSSEESVRRIDEAAHGTKALRMDAWTSMELPVPPIEEQNTIATFLDRETAKIDALIAEQQRLIELLKEKRQAVISHAVTKGLNPDAPMKDSGIEWLGEVPAHWEVMPFKRHLIFLTSGSRGWAEHYSDEGALFIRISNLTRDSIQIDLSDIQRVTVPEGAEGERTKVQSGDVLFSITAYLGSVAVVPEELEPAYVSQHVALARLDQQHLLPAWAAYVTLSFIGKTYLETQGYGGTKIQLSLDDVANLVMTLPDTEEQSIIAAFIDHETAKIDALTAEAQTAITLLQERRTALISAAVTGKIDVRGFTSDSTH